MAQSKLPNVRDRQLWLSSITAQRHSRQAGTSELHYFARDSDSGECNYPGQFYPHIASVFQSAPAAWTHFGSRLHWGTKETKWLDWATWRGSGLVYLGIWDHYGIQLSAVNTGASCLLNAAAVSCWKIRLFHIEGVIKSTAANWLFSTIFPAVP